MQLQSSMGESSGLYPEAQTHLLLLEGHNLQGRYKDYLQPELIKIIVPPKKEHNVLQITANLSLPIEHPSRLNHPL